MREPRRAGDGGPGRAREAAGLRRAAGGALLDLRQTGCCGEAQADGVPCPSVGSDCEACAQAGSVRVRFRDRRHA